MHIKIFLKIEQNIMLIKSKLFSRYCNCKKLIKCFFYKYTTIISKMLRIFSSFYSRTPHFVAFIYVQSNIMHGNYITTLRCDIYF